MNRNVRMEASEEMNLVTGLIFLNATAVSNAMHYHAIHLRMTTNPIHCEACDGRIGGNKHMLGTPTLDHIQSMQCLSTYLTRPLVFLRLGLIRFLDRFAGF